MGPESWHLMNTSGHPDIGFALRLDLDHGTSLGTRIAPMTSLRVLLREGLPFNRP